MLQPWRIPNSDTFDHIVRLDYFPAFRQPQNVTFMIILSFRGIPYVSGHSRLCFWSFQCKVGLFSGFLAAQNKTFMIILLFQYSHIVSGCFWTQFRGFWPKENPGRSAGVLCHWYTCSPAVFLVCLLTFSLGLQRFYVLDLVISPAAGSRHPHVCSMVK